MQDPSCNANQDIAKTHMDAGANAKKTVKATSKKHVDADANAKKTAKAKSKTHVDADAKAKKDEDDQSAKTQNAK